MTKKNKKTTHFTPSKRIKNIKPKGVTLKSFAKDLLENGSDDEKNLVKKWFQNKRPQNKLRTPSSGFAGRNWKKHGTKRGQKKKN